MREARGSLKEEDQFIIDLSTLSLEQLYKLSEINKSFKDTLKSIIQKRQENVVFSSNDRFPSALLTHTIGDQLTNKDLFHLSKVSHFFHRTLKDTLYKRQLNIIKELDADIERLKVDIKSVEEDDEIKKISNFEKIKTMIDTFILKFLNEEAEKKYQENYISKLILPYIGEKTSTKISYELLKKLTHCIHKNNTTYELWIMWDSIHNNDLTFMSQNPDTSNLSEINCQFRVSINDSYSCSIFSKQYSTYSFSFDLIPFLKNVLPAMKGLTVRPELEKSEVSSLKRS